MFKHYFEQIHNVEVWPIVSLSIFFIFFICLILWVWKADKYYIKSMSNLPIEDVNSETDDKSLNNQYNEK